MRFPLFSTVMPPAARESSCVVCGPTSVVPVMSCGEFRIVRCGRCGLIYVDGAHELAWLEKFYGPAYFRSDGDTVCGYRDYLWDRPLHLTNAGTLLETIEGATRGPGRRLLDIGCAYGFLLEAAGARGWSASGVEIAAEASQFARDRLGLDVYAGNLEDAPFEPETFDVVCMIGTIEHMTDPMQSVRVASRLLKKGGLLVVTTIDVEGRLGYFSWKPPEHLFYFSFRTLSNLLQKAGFSVEFRRTYWVSYRLSDVAFRLLTYWGLASTMRVVRMLEALNLHRVPMRIPTNEILVISRKA